MTSTGAGPGGPALLAVATSRQVRSCLRDLLHGRWPLLTATIAVMVAESAISLAGPVAIGWITQAIADHRHLAALAGPVALLAGAAVGGWGATVLLARLMLPAVASVREDAVAAAVDLPVDMVEAGGIGDLVSRVSGDVELVSDAASGTFGSFIGSGLAILSTLIGLAALDWRFALAGLLAVPIQAHTLRWYLRTSRPIYAAGRIADGNRAAALLTGFTAVATLRALRLGPRQHDRIAAASAGSMDCEFRAVRAATRFYGRLNLAEFTGLGAILLVAFLLVRAGLASIGGATTAALFFAGLFDPINTVLGVFDSIQQAGAGFARLVGITVAGPDGSTRPGDRTAHPGCSPVPEGSPARTAHLAATHLRFRYGQGPDVLRDVTLRLAPGQHVAVVGTTGSGKSTLASLLAGLRHPSEGSVTLDGTALRDIDLPQRQAALITQETHVFAGTIAGNLRLARPEATDEAIRSAIDTIGAGAWIDTLPDGIQTLVGGGGHPLTASQAQQLALARIYLLDPPVVILDEATAEAGSDSARSLDRAAAAVVRGRSAVVIAHRLTQTAAADLILVMEDGRIIERGTHDQLLASAGRYAALWSAWKQVG